MDLLDIIKYNMERMNTMKRITSKILVAVLMLIAIVSTANTSYAKIRFPKLMALEKIRIQLSAPAPQLLSPTPEHFGPNIAGLVSWCTYQFFSTFLAIGTNKMESLQFVGGGASQIEKYIIVTKRR